jgi:site-specific DNA-methyltransferase (adenine-specific)
MKDLPDNSVDMVLTDPPYGIRYRSNRRKNRFDFLKNDDNDLRLRAYAEFARVLKDDSVCVVFASWKNLVEDVIELRKYFDIKNVIVWHKGGGGMGDLKHTLATDYEVAIVGHKGRCRLRGKREGSVWRVDKVAPGKMVHPTEKPVELLEKLVCKFTDADAVVLDAFSGSGSTGVACINTGRRFIGMEQDVGYFVTAANRIEEAHHGRQDQGLLQGQ